MLASLHRFLSAAKKGGCIGVCLLFHRIAEIDRNTIGPNPQLSIASDVFEQIIAHISETFNPIGIPELVEFLRTNQPLPKDAISITFDDGFSDNWTTAYPILEKYGVPATIYVTTGFVGGEAYPYEFQLADWLGRREYVAFEWEGCEYKWELEDKAERETCYRAIKALTESLRPRTREALLRRIYDGESPSRENGLFMNWGQVRALDRSPLITIGGHTDTHPPLTVLSANEARHEIENGQRIFARELGHPIQHFSFPYGAHNERLCEFVTDAGYVSAVTTEGAGVRLDTRPMAIPRIEVRADAVSSTATVPAFMEGLRQK